MVVKLTRQAPLRVTLCKKGPLCLSVPEIVDIHHSITLHNVKCYITPMGVHFGRHHRHQDYVPDVGTSVGPSTFYNCTRVSS
jgi:hypothetical protein